jgi:hypothetical protein
MGQCVKLGWGKLVPTAAATIQAQKAVDCLTKIYTVRSNKLEETGATLKTTENFHFTFKWHLSSCITEQYIK